VAGSSNALITIHKFAGVIEILAGEPEESGYVEGVGRTARFNAIYGISQLEYKYILSDYGNHCLRSVDYISNETQTFAGACLSWGTADGSLVSARFASPSGMTRDLGNPDVIYLVELRALRKIDLLAETVITLPGSNLPSGYIYGVTMSPAGNLFITSLHGIMQFNLNETVQWLTGNTTQGAACDECDISSARFSGPVGLRFITPKVLMVADYNNHKLRLVNLTSGIVTAIGAGEGYQDGPYQDSKLISPYSIAIDSSSIYIGAVTAIDGSVRKLAYSGMCDIL